MTFKLDDRLANDTILMSENAMRYVLLMNNAAVPWLILVPKVEETELHELHHGLFDSVNLESRRLAQWLKSEFDVDKINIAAIGNVVQQLHIHIIGRRKDDYCWPNVVWGTQAPETYTDEAANSIKERLTRSFG